MSRFNLEVLNDKEFEELSKDLLENELGVNFQIFKRGKDKGIDLRYAKSIENEIIVQAKQYGKSTFSNLKKSLSLELDKINALSNKPNRYILMTSFDASVHQIDQIIKTMHPYILNSQDVYTRERIINLILKYPQIEKKFYKLWLTSTNILSTILHNAASSRSEFFSDKILKKVSLYVPTQTLNIANEKLKENHFLIVTGDPGIGKTTISYILICNLLADGFKLIYIDDQLKEAEEILSNSPEEKQVVFFDDVFGANLTEINNPRNSESKIINFIDRIKSNKNKLMIMTSRTTILRQALDKFESLNRSGYSDYSKYELNLQSYSKLDKAKILYNHIYHSGITLNQYDTFFKNKNYLKIINHKSYFPRLIEFITNGERISKIPSEEMENFIFNSLNNPQEIWFHAFEKQQTEEEQFLLLTLFSLGSYNVKDDFLETAFHSRYEYEIKENGYKLRPGAYITALKKLIGGFIKSEIKSKSKTNYFSFINPSIADFFINYLNERKPDCKRILYSAAFFEQILNNFGTDKFSAITLSEKIFDDFYPRYQNIEDEMMKNSGGNSRKNVIQLFIRLKYFPKHQIEKHIYQLFSNWGLSTATDIKFYTIYHILEEASNFDSVKKTYRH